MAEYEGLTVPTATAVALSYIISNPPAEGLPPFLPKPKRLLQAFRWGRGSPGPWNVPSMI